MAFYITVLVTFGIPLHVLCVARIFSNPFQSPYGIFLEKAMIIVFKNRISFNVHRSSEVRFPFLLYNCADAPQQKREVNLRKTRAESFSAYRVVICPERNATRWSVAQAQRGRSDSGEVIKSLLRFNNFGNLFCY